MPELDIEGRGSFLKRTDSTDSALDADLSRRTDSEPPSFLPRPKLRYNRGRSRVVDLEKIPPVSNRTYWGW